MSKFEAFLKAILQAVFKEYPYDKGKSKMSFEKVKYNMLNVDKGEKHGKQE